MPGSRLRVGSARRSLTGFLEELAFKELAVEALASEELGVGSLLHQSALLDDRDLVGTKNGREPVCDDDRGSVAQ